MVIRVFISLVLFENCFLLSLPIAPFNLGILFGQACSTDFLTSSPTLVQTMTEALNKKFSTIFTSAIGSKATKDDHIKLFHAHLIIINVLYVTVPQKSAIHDSINGLQDKRWVLDHEKSYYSTMKAYFSLIMTISHTAPGRRIRGLPESSTWVTRLSAYAK